MKEKRKIIVIGSVLFITILLLSTGSVIADSLLTGTACIAGQPLGSGYGDHGQDPISEYGNMAKHPQNDAYENHIVIAYAMETGYYFQGRYVWNVRISLSSDGGQNWNTFEWVRTDPYYDQDYPDVHFVYDTVDDELKIIVVWQERPRTGGYWEIKTRERSMVSGQWGGTYSVSVENDDEDNILPKIATCSENSVTYWNIVWQRFYTNYNMYGIFLNIFTRALNYGSFMNSPQGIVDCPPDIRSSQHPAIECIHDGSTNENLYITYDWTALGYSGVNVEYGSLISMRGPYSRSGQLVLDYNLDYESAYPDITVIEPPVGQITVDCVWISDENNIRYSRSTDGGQSFSQPTNLSFNGVFGLRNVAINMVAYDSDPDVLQVSVVFSGYDDFNNEYIYFMKRLSTNGVWNQGFEDLIVVFESYDNDYVDIAIQDYDGEDGDLIYSHMSWQQKYQNIPYSVWYTRENET